MFCSECGKEIEDNAKFCKYCGAEIKVTQSHQEIVNDINKKQPTLGESIIGLVFIVIVIFMFRSCNTSSDNVPQISPEQKQERMEVTNNFMLEAQKGGLVTNLKKECSEDGEFCSYYFIVNESMWDMFSFEDKQNFNRFAQEYAQLRSNEAVAEVQGHYSGKVLADKFKGVIREK